jgi:AcrR family transcriptional regulator
MSKAKPEPTEPRRPGRPMSPDVERRLRDASLHVLEAHGTTGLTVERICEAAGVPRSTFYRRWPSAADAVAAGVMTMIGTAIPAAPDTGDVREDVVQLGTQMASLLREGRFGRVLGFIMAEVQHKPEFRAAALEITRHRRKVPNEVVERGKQAKLIATNVDTDMVVEVLAGATIFRHFFGETPPDRTYVERVVDLLVQSDGAAGKTAASAAKRAKPAKPASGRTRRRAR